MFIKYPILILGLLFLVHSSQDVPIQASGYGFSVGDLYGTLHIEFFLDFQCGDSKDSYETWINVRKAISLHQNKIKLTYQFNPLPYHFFATYIHEAFFYILKNKGALAAEEYIDFVFKYQDNFTEEAHINKTAKQFSQYFSNIIAKNFKVDAGELSKQFLFGSESFKTLRNHWRYTTIMNGVSGAPIFSGNGVRIDGAEDFSFLDWIQFLKKYT